MTKNKVIGTSIGIFTIILILLYTLKNTVLSNVTINYIGIIMALILIMNALLVLILVPKDHGKLFVSRPIGYGLTINPRNPLGLLIYAFLIILVYLISI
ncbi:hypothetical protein [Enterococcus raffinosus]|uniref:Uncharacterized protein n=1 Tax=Enterococcus raffinosus TaxID=71452 RepID=A0AAW8T577_9ENTE|nr:hypothetical protein [Enterococcus raffinosus]MDT2521979.1 hypothetical protein [Enterococcus raffinosus]MDT2528324.1 hypothetical protein [Enterococcus raffinosus]MDT2533211.1 hypothetical protein [Enterococcus raffinosus]MDT2543651.1 hypothetical protein [Enterococcus raffinosus]MDT2553765.1 hypothetical protein [Enterococcus raffinosus]